MCGIVGILSDEPVVDRLVSGLKRLEYRGYDSAGVAVIHDAQILKCRAPGKIINLDQKLRDFGVQGTKIDGSVGIAHTRWATHGLPTELNAHPHTTDAVAIVHNGIVENHSDLRRELKRHGVSCASQTDSEVIAHLLTLYEQELGSPLKAIFKTLEKIEGAYALAMIFKSHPGHLYGTRKGSPLAIGEGMNGERLIGSDALALSGLAQNLTYLEDGDVAMLSKDHIQIFDQAQQKTTRTKESYSDAFSEVSKGPYAHFMLKEIFEQPDVVQQTLSHYLNATKDGLSLPDLKVTAKDLKRITIIACGTSYYAGLVAKQWIETLARIPVDVDVASEFRYRKPPLMDDSLSIFISQSGETADTMAAQKYVKTYDQATNPVGDQVGDRGNDKTGQKKQVTLGIINVPGSSLAREVDVSLMTYAGPEIGVASTKAFSTQLVVLAVLALELAHKRGLLSDEDLKKHCRYLGKLPGHLQQALTPSGDLITGCQAIAESLQKAKDILFLGRGASYPIALEGALKLKEISYIHAEGYAAGEMKHGPIALIDENVPIIAVAPFDPLFDKTASNVEEAAARKGQVVLISDQKGQDRFDAPVMGRMTLPDSTDLTAPFLYTLPMQLLAYYTAVLKGTDVDQPRNLAKSVTVE